MNERLRQAVTCTTCPYCGVGCGVQVGVAAAAEPRTVTVKGDLHHPANAGKLCIKGSALHETLDLKDRLLYPTMNGQQISWDSAIDTIAQRFSDIQQQHGLDSIALYVSGQLLTEDYYVANKFMKGFLGSANIDTNSRLCMSSAVAGYKRAFGNDAVPTCYEDLEHADLLVLTGSNAAWTHPVLYQRMRKARQLNPQRRVVLIDPRRTATAELADLHLAPKPGSDGLLFNGLLVYLHDHAGLARDYIARHTEGFEAAFSAARQATPDIASVAAQCELPAAQVLQFYQWFASTARAVTFYSQGINQSSSGVDKCNAIINCHLASGKLGYAGAGPFSITGQPNAMGGREVGGLANQLAAHMDFDTPGARDRVARFWQASNMATRNGLKALDLFEAIEHGSIKALWILSTNPMVSLPDSRRVRRALEKCELVIVSDSQALTDTTHYAHICLPALTWGEKDGTVTNSERCISRQRAFLPAPCEARADWWMLTAVARRMGFADAFHYRCARDIFVEHAALSGYENNNDRAFDISGLSNLTAHDYDQLQPIQWPVNEQFPLGRQRLFTDGRFYTPTGKAQFIAIQPRLPAQSISPTFPWLLNTGRIRDQWHTMTRTGNALRLFQHTPEPRCAIHPEDAAQANVSEGDILRVFSNTGSVLVRVECDPQQRRGELFIPIHWNDQFASAAVVNQLIVGIADPLSGQPESKQTPVAFERLTAGCHALIATRCRLSLPRNSYWSLVRVQDYYCYEWVSPDPPHSCQAQLAALLPAAPQAMTYSDPNQSDFRAVCFQEQAQQPALVAFSSLSRAPIPVERDWLWQQLHKNDWTMESLHALLAGKSAQPQPPQGKIICACFQVGSNLIQQTITDGCHTVESLGRTLRCGTNCGSCVPEIKQLLANQHDYSITPQATRAPPPPNGAG